MNNHKHLIFTVYPYLLNKLKTESKTLNVNFDLTAYSVIERIRTVIAEVQKKQGRGADYYESRSKLAELLHVSTSQIDNAFHTLKTMGLIQKTRKEVMPRGGKAGKNASWKLTEGKWRKFISWSKKEADQDHYRWKTNKQPPEHTFYTYIPSFHKEKLGFNRTAQIQYFELHCLFYKQGCTDVSKFTERAKVCRASHYNYINTSSGIGQKCFTNLFEKAGEKYRIKNSVLSTRTEYLPTAQKEKKERLSHTVVIKKPTPKRALTKTEAYQKIEFALSKHTERIFSMPVGAFAPELKNCLDYLGEAFDLSAIHADLSRQYGQMIQMIEMQMSNKPTSQFEDELRLFIRLYQEGLRNIKQYFSLKLDEQVSQKQE